MKFSGLEASGWYVESAKEAMESGAMTFAGKYSEPDYETLVDGDCDLAIESTMILHYTEGTGNDRRSWDSGICRLLQL